MVIIIIVGPVVTAQPAQRLIKKQQRQDDKPWTCITSAEHTSSVVIGRAALAAVVAYVCCVAPLCLSVQAIHCRGRINNSSAGQSLIYQTAAVEHMWLWITWFTPVCLFTDLGFSSFYSFTLMMCVWRSLLFLSPLFFFSHLASEFCFSCVVILSRIFQLFIFFVLLRRRRRWVLTTIFHPTLVTITEDFVTFLPCRLEFDDCGTTTQLFEVFLCVVQLSSSVCCWPLLFIWR